MDPINEITDEDTQTEETIDEKEEYDNCEDLARKKRTENEFNAQDNMAQFQAFVQNPQNLYINYVQNSQPVVSKTSKAKTYDLKKQDDCTEFVECYKKGEYLSVAIVLSVFEMVAVSDLLDLETKLLEYLPDLNTSNNEDNQTKTMPQDAYLSLRTILSVIGGRRFITKDEQECIGFGEDSEQIFINFFRLFPTLRNAIVSWIVQVSNTYKCRTSFEAYQMIMAYVRIISIDFREAKKQVLPKLYANPMNVWLLGNIVYKLYDNTKTRSETQDIIFQWINSNSLWLWKPLCLTYSLLADNQKYLEQKTRIIDAVGKKLMFFKRSDYVFIAQLLFRSKSFRSLFAETFSYAYDNISTEEDEVSIARLYLRLIRQCYYLVRYSHIELPLVACDTKEQQKCLTNVVGKVMEKYRLRKQLYTILQAYLEELSQYQYNSELIRHISAYFYNMSLAGIEYKKDILDFLVNCHTTAAQKIYEQLF